MKTPHTLDGFLFSCTAELFQILKDVSGTHKRSQMLEDWCWERPEVKAAAKRLKLKRKARRKPGALTKAERKTFKPKIRKNTPVRSK